MGKLNNILITGYIITVLIQNSIWCREYEECEGVTEPDTVVASKRSCAKYIFCDGENSYEGECLAGNYFNEREEICDEPENVDCHIKEDESVQSIYAENFKKPEIERDKNENINEATIGDFDDLEDSDDINWSEIPDDIDKVEQENEIVTQSQTPKCPKLKGFRNVQHIANPESCVAFYTCYNGIAIPMLCPSKMYFNDETGKCQSQIPKNCKLHNSVILNCRKGMTDYMPHPQRCEYYHYCLNGFLLIMRCPYDFTWHYERRTCVHKSQSKCYFEQSLIYRYQN